MWSSQDQAAILDRSDSQDTARFERAFDFLEASKRSVKRLHDGMAQTGIKMVGRKIQRIHAARPKLHICDALSEHKLERLEFMRQHLLDVAPDTNVFVVQ